MPEPITGGIVAGAGLIGSGIQSNAANRAAKAQAGAIQQGINTIENYMQPYLAAGQQGMAGQQALLGLSGAEAQQQAIAGLENSPLFAALVRQQENALLQNASATGGLRGGNTQAALAQFRPAMLNQQIQQQLEQLGGFTQLGAGTAASASGAIADLLGQKGAARAGGIMGTAAPVANLFNLPGQFLGMQYGAGVQNPGFAGLFK